ncbi:MAG: hypothetical protein NVSMB47_19740 [Polyangiales bacterium]
MTVALGVALASAVIVPLAERPARASVVDVGIEAGAQKRELSGTSYKTSFAWQLHAELALIPPILMIGPYATFAHATPDVPTKESPSNVAFRTFGLRAKLKLPIPGDFKPYGVAGLGWVHGEFPDQTLTICDPQQPTLCASRQFPNATANFVEFVLGGGLLWEIASPLAITAEFNWRPTTGYKNDAYQKQLDGSQASGTAQTNPPDPSRNGVSWTGMLGLALVL